jgi:hypothetical protein
MDLPVDGLGHPGCKECFIHLDIDHHPGNNDQNDNNRHNGPDNNHQFFQHNAPPFCEWIPLKNGIAACELFFTGYEKFSN